MEQTAEPVLDIKGLRTIFRTRGGEITAVNDIDLTVAAGETLALVGESGSGKSVTSLSVMRLLTRNIGVIAAGSIRLATSGGAVRDLVSLDEESMRRIRGDDIGMIFQEPMSSLNPVFTIGDQIGEPIRIHRGADRKAAMDAAVALLESVGIPDARRRAGQYPHELSGGMRQRATIAMALACDPALLIADEPTTALDVTIQAQILDLLLKLQRERGMAMLFVTHNLGVVAEIAHRVAVMYAGRIVEEGPVGEVFRNPKHPYTMGLLASMPRLGDAARMKQAGEKLAAIPGMVPSLMNIPSGCAFSPALQIRDRCLSRRGSRARTGQFAAPQPLHQMEGDLDEHPLLSVRDLSKHYTSRGTRLNILQGISFDLGKGEVVGLVGESGSGKTTIGRTVLRLVEPSSGSVRFDGTELTALSASALRRQRPRMQYIFQDPFASLSPRMTIGEILTEGLKIQGIGTARDRLERARSALAQVDLPADAINRYAHEFSGGQRQLHRDRPCVDVVTRIHRRRRAGFGARRVDPGAGDQPAARTAAAAWPDHAVHLA
ncbi:ABC transporter ATP-binding protein (plasmid) [Rhizobium leguminosarum]|nr:ABC transporter ATP-binding protein [Rhizobium leguminosarum]